MIRDSTHLADSSSAIDEIPSLAADGTTRSQQNEQPCVSADRSPKLKIQAAANEGA